MARAREALFFLLYTPAFRTVTVPLGNFFASEDHLETVTTVIMRGLSRARVRVRVRVRIIMGSHAG